MKNQNIAYYNFIQSKHLSFKSKNEIKKIFFVLDKIIKNINNTKDIYHSLSDNYKFDINLKDLKKFNKYKTVVIIGMGGSILGSKAIFNFLK